MLATEYGRTIAIQALLPVSNLNELSNELKSAVHYFMFQPSKKYANADKIFRLFFEHNGDFEKRDVRSMSPVDYMDNGLKTIYNTILEERRNMGA